MEDWISRCEGCKYARRDEWGDFYCKMNCPEPEWNEDEEEYECDEYEMYDPFEEEDARAELADRKYDEMRINQYFS